MFAAEEDSKKSPIKFSLSSDRESRGDTNDGDDETDPKSDDIDDHEGDADNTEEDQNDGEEEDEENDEGTRIYFWNVFYIQYNSYLETTKRDTAVENLDPAECSQ